MTNKKILWGMLAGLLAFGMLFIACENGTQEVEGKVGLTYEQAPQVGSVTVTKTTNKEYYIVSWEAVEGDGISYEVYFKQDGKNSSLSLGYSNAQNMQKYDSATGDASPNDDFDKWSYRVESLGNLSPGSYRFGIRTSLSGSTVASTYSGVTWAEPITVTAGPKVASVSAAKTTDGNYIIVSWNAVTGADGYRVSLEKDGNNYGSSYGQNNYVYEVADGGETVNNDKSKWSYRMSYYYYGSGTYRFKVEASTNYNDISVIPSAGVWSGTVTLLP